MNIFRNLLTGLLSALASLVIVIGALAISAAEGFTLTVPTVVEPTAALETPRPTPLQPVQNVTVPVLASPTPTYTSSPTAAASATQYAPTPCPVPSGWNEYTIRSGDSLSNLARRYNVTTAQLMKANCLVTQSLLPGSILYLPPRPTGTAVIYYPTPTVSCGIPWGWVRYIVQPGDTLFRLSVIYNVSMLDLQYANCLSSTYLVAGQALWVPYQLPSRTPANTSTPRTPTATRPTSTPPPTATVPSPVVPTATIRPSATLEPTAAPTSTPVPTLVPTTAVPTLAPATAVPTVGSTAAGPQGGETLAASTSVSATSVPESTAASQ